jgi:hypothetical protein
MKMWESDFLGMSSKHKSDNNVQSEKWEDSVGREEELQGRILEK